MDRKNLPEKVQLALSLLSQGSHQEAKELFAQIYIETASPQARSGIQKALQKQSPYFTHKHQSDIRHHLRPLLEDYKRSGIFKEGKGPLPGWLYSRLIDKKFIDHRLDASFFPQSKEPALDIRKVLSDESPEELIESIKHTKDLREKYALINQIVNKPFRAVLEDSFKDSSLDNLPGKLKACFHKAQLNILILGAGPVGLTLASSLKLLLGAHTNVVVIENRCDYLHYKKPYSRNWLTHIPLCFLEDLISQDIFDILSSLAQEPYIGVPINILETLLLLSNKTLEVRFVFNQNYDLSFVENSSIHYIFDATGARLKHNASNPSQKPQAVSMHIKGLEGFEKSYSAYGITKNLNHEEITLKSRLEDEFIRSTHNDKILKVASCKVMNIPVEFYDDLLAEVKKINWDNRFYLWPGKLKAEINSGLLIINLLKEEYDFLCTQMNRSLHPTDVLKIPKIRQYLAHEVIGLFEFIIKSCDKHQDILLELPYIFQPYILAREDFGTLHGKDLIPVGDSLYNGNPKVGNGLSCHLGTVKKISNTVLLNYIKP